MNNYDVAPCVLGLHAGSNPPSQINAFSFPWVFRIVWPPVLHDPGKKVMHAFSVKFESSLLKATQSG